MATAVPVAITHEHVHGAGWPQGQYGDHVDYAHDGHQHAEHEGHCPRGPRGEVTACLLPQEAR